MQSAVLLFKAANPTGAKVVVPVPSEHAVHLIDKLQQENDILKAEISRREAEADAAPIAAASNGDAASAELRQKDAQIADLKRTVKELEKEITKLNESVVGWQKKYEFLSTEAPSAYQSTAEK